MVPSSRRSPPGGGAVTADGDDLNRELADDLEDPAGIRLAATLRRTTPSILPPGDRLGSPATPPSATASGTAWIGPHLDLPETGRTAKEANPYLRGFR
jgi:hypothetical protein